MENVIIGNIENFDTLIQSENYTIVDFWAEWCGPCRALTPILESVAQERPDVQVVKVNVDENSELSAKFGIRSIPTVFIYKKGEQTGKFVGLKPKEEILSLI